MGDAVRKTLSAVVGAALVAIAAGCSDGGPPPGPPQGTLLSVVDAPISDVPPAGKPAPSLTGPNFRYIVAGREAGTRSYLFNRALGRSWEARAAPGHELLVAVLHAERPEAPQSDEELAAINVNVKLGDRVVTVEHQPGLYVTVVASAPTGTPVSLSVTDDGRTQSIDLRTGTYGPDAVPELQTQPIQQLSGGHSATTTVSAFGIRRPVVERYTFDTAVRNVYRSDLHWAADGRAWLVVSLRVESNAWQTDPPTFALRVVIDIRASLTLTLPDGSRIAAMPATHDNYALYGLPVTLLNAFFDVPAGTRAGTVTFTLRAKAFALGGGVDDRPIPFNPRPNSSTATVALPS